MFQEDDVKFSIFEPTLQKINRAIINPPEEKITQYKNAFIDFFYHFKTNLGKHDPIINSYKKTDFMGSFLDNLLIGNPYKEFDGAILIKLPMNLFDIIRSDSGYIGIRLNIPNELGGEKADIYRRWLDDENYIMPNKFRSWCESILTKSANSLPAVGLSKSIQGDYGNYTFTMSKSGPSFTMHVKRIRGNESLEFDVDIHVCIEFGDLPNFFITDLNHSITKHEWLAVPTGDNRNWRYMFPHDEYLVLKDRYYMKSTLRLIKKLRDKYQMSYLTNYHIKTLFLHNCNNRNIEFWQDSLSCLVVKAIKALQIAIECNEITHYWDNRLNLLDNLDDKKKSDCHNKLITIMRNINKYADEGTPEMIINIFLTEMEKNDLREEERRPIPQTVDDDSDDDTYRSGSSSANYSSYRSPPQMAQQQRPTESNGTNIALGVGAAAAALLGGFMLYRQINKDNKK